MTAPALTFTTAPYAASAWARLVTRERRKAPRKDYALFDERGRWLGTVVAPEERPRSGPGAPTVFLRRPL
jgi:hypothetical protein